MSVFFLKFKIKLRQLYNIDGLYFFGIELDRSSLFEKQQLIYNNASRKAASHKSSHLVWDLYYKELWFYALKNSKKKVWLVSLFLKYSYTVYLFFEFFTSLITVKKNIYDLRVTEPSLKTPIVFYAYSDANAELLWYFNILSQNFSIGKVEVAQSTVVEWRYVLSFIPALLRQKWLFPHLPLWQIIRSTSLRHAAAKMFMRGAKLLMEECADRSQTAILSGISQGNISQAIIFVRSPFMISLNYLGAKVIVPNYLVKMLMERSNKEVICLNIPFIHYRDYIYRPESNLRKPVLGYAPVMYSLTCNKQDRLQTDRLFSSLGLSGEYEIFVRRHPQERNMSYGYDECYKNNTIIYSSDVLRYESIALEDFFKKIDIWITSFSTTIISSLQNGCPVIVILCIKSDMLLELAKISHGLLRITDGHEEFHSALNDIKKLIQNPADLVRRTRKIRLDLNIITGTDHAKSLLPALSKAILS